MMQHLQGAYNKSLVKGAGGMLKWLRQHGFIVMVQGTTHSVMRSPGGSSMCTACQASPARMRINQHRQNAHATQSISTAAQWSQEEQQKFDEAIARFPDGISNRWALVAQVCV